MHCNLHRQTLQDWTREVRELYALKTTNDPLAYDQKSAVNNLELEVFLKSRDIFTKYQINPETLEFSITGISGQTDAEIVGPTFRSASSFGGGLMMLEPLVLHSNDSNSQIYHQLPSSIAASSAIDDNEFVLGGQSVEELHLKDIRKSKFSNMDIYQFYLECKQFPTYQLLQSSQRTVLTRNWMAARNELKACRIIQRLEYLKENDLCTFHEPVNVNEREPKPKAHWDYLLKEMKWLSCDFWEEREWKKRVAAVIAKEAVEYLHNKMNAQTITKYSLHPPMTVAKFFTTMVPTATRFASTADVRGGILGPPKPSSSGSSTSVSFWEGRLLPLVPLSSGQPSSSPSTCTFSNNCPERACLSAESLEDMLLIYLTSLHAKNWPLIYEAILQSFPNCKMSSPLDCSEKYRTISNSQVSTQFSFIKEHEFFTEEKIEHFLKINDVINQSTGEQRPNRWIPSQSNKKTNFPFNPALIYQAHPSHEAALKKPTIPEGDPLKRPPTAEFNQSVTLNAFPSNSLQNIKVTQQSTPTFQSNAQVHSKQTIARAPANPSANKSDNAEMTALSPPNPHPSLATSTAVPFPPISVQRIPANPIFTAPPQGASVIHPTQSSVQIPLSSFPSPNTAMSSKRNVFASSSASKRTKKNSTELILDE